MASDVAAREALTTASRRLDEARNRRAALERRIVETERLLQSAREDVTEAEWVHYDAAHRVSTCPDCDALPGESCRDLDGLPMQRRPRHYGSSMHHSVRPVAEGCVR